MKQILALKSILLLALVISCISNYTYSQQSESKILPYIYKLTSDKGIYFEPMDSIINKFKNSIAAHLKNQSIGDERRIHEMRTIPTVFEDLLKVVPSEMLIFDNTYPVDTIFFFFNNKKLIRCWYQFKLPTNQYLSRDRAIDSIHKKLNQNFPIGHEGYETDLYGAGGFTWTDRYCEVNFLTDVSIPGIQSTSNNTIAYISIEMIHPMAGNENIDRQIAFIKNNRSGRGVSKFTLSLSKLENILNSATTYKSFELQLGDWISYGNLNLESDDYIQNVAQPLFQINYDTKIKSRFYSIVIDINKTLKNPIKEVHVTCQLNGLQLSEFKDSLRINGYMLNEEVSGILHKFAYQKRSGSTVVTIKYNNNGTYTIGISK